MAGVSYAYWTTKELLLEFGGRVVEKKLLLGGRAKGLRFIAFAAFISRSRYVNRRGFWSKAAAQLLRRNRIDGDGNGEMVQ